MSSKYFQINPDAVNEKILTQASQIIDNQGLAIIPTDTNYALACKLGNTEATERMRSIRKLKRDHLFTFLTHNFNALGKYSVVGNDYFRLLKKAVPGPYVFVMQATREVPKAFASPKRRTIGIRVPNNLVLLKLLATLGSPMLSCTLQFPEQDESVSELAGHEQWLTKVADVILDIGKLSSGMTTVLDLTGDEIVVLREDNSASNLFGADDN